MAKFELSINVKYLPEWGVWEGVRELIQNGRDAEVEHNAPLTVDWKKGTLRIENEGAHLSREALLFGTTTKGGRADLIGKFGEGLKLGVLALVRAGRPVTIRSGSEVWDPTIARSEKYDAEVLVFDIKGNREDKKRVRVEIGGVIESEWLDFRSRFLFLKDKREAIKDAVETRRGTLMLNKKYAGKVYNKGIFVMNETKLTYGYDLPDAELDRDRKMVNHTELTDNTAAIWHLALDQRPDLLASYVDMITKIDAPADITAVSYYTSPDTDIIEEVTKSFKKQFGDNAVPVLSTAESADVAHFGKKGIVVSSQLAGVLKNTIGDTESIKKQLAKETVKIYSIVELCPTSLENYGRAMELLSAGLEVSIEDLAARVDIVDFRSDTLLGLHCSHYGYGGNGKASIQIAHKLLKDVASTLSVLTHEFAHDYGYDGSKSHVEAIEATNLRIMRHMLKGGAR